MCSEMESSAAIWRLVSPRETSIATSSPRGVSQGKPLSLAAGGRWWRDGILFAEGVFDGLLGEHGPPFCQRHLPRGLTQAGTCGGQVEGPVPYGVRAARAPDLFTQRLGHPPQPRRTLRHVPGSGPTCHYLQAVGDVLPVSGSLEQLQALLAQHPYPSMVTPGQRRKGRMHEADGDVRVITDLSEQHQALIEQHRRPFGTAMNQLVIPRLPREVAVLLTFPIPGSTPGLHRSTISTAPDLPWLMPILRGCRVCQ